MFARDFVILLGATALVLVQSGFSQSCSFDTTPVEGHITDIEKAPLSGTICGFTEFQYRGAWSASTAYISGDSVRYGGRFWRTSGSSQGNTPQHGSAWQPIDAVTYNKRVKEVQYFFSWDTSAPCDDHYTSSESVENYYRLEETWNSGCTDIIDISSGAGIHLQSSQDDDSHYDSSRTWTYGPDGSGPWYFTSSSDGPNGPSGGSSSGTSDPAWHIRLSDLYYAWYYGTLSLQGNTTWEVETKPTLRTETADGSHSYSTGICLTGSQSGSEVVTTALSEPKKGTDAMAQAVSSIQEQDWVPSVVAVAYLGSWGPQGAGFAFSGQAIRYRVAFGCLADDADLEFHYRVWPIGTNETADGKIEKEVKNVKALRVEEKEDGTKEVLGFIEPKDGYNKRLIKVILLTPCGGGGGQTGMSNGTSLNSANWWVSLGKGVGGAGVGNLRVEEHSLSAASSRPTRLRYDGGINNQVETIENPEGGVRQIKFPSGLADVVAAPNGFSYEIRFYELADVDDKNLQTGLYQLSGLPFSIWKVENPDGASGNDKLKITHTEGGEEEYLFTEGIGGLWSLNQNGAGIEERTESILGNGNRQVIRTVKDGNGVASYQVREEYHTYPWGERMVAQSEDPNGSNLTTTWSYYDVTPGDGAAYGRLKQVIHPSGSWQRYQYDSQGRQNKLISCYLDEAVGASEANSRVVTTTWSTDGLTATIVETVLGNEVGRRYWIKSSDGSQIVEQVCTVVGAAVNATTNLTTTTTYVTSGEFQGEVASVRRPDGTMTIYSRAHANGLFTTTVKNGQPNGGNTDVIAGQQTITIEDEMGNPVSSETKDIASALTLESRTYTELDEFGRPLRIDYNDGSYETTTYACCGVETTRNRDGEITLFDYDDLGRESTETRDGLTTIFTYDGSGRIKTRTRKGTDNSEMLLETNTYDLAGRQETGTDALNHVTEFEEEILGNGRTQRTTTYPDTGTSIEIRHRDGRQYSLSGTAVNPVKFEYGAQSGSESTKRILIGDAAEETEWSTTYTDLAGRTKQVVQANGGITNFYYNAAGQLYKQTDPDGVTTLFTYNGQGERQKTVIDIDRDDQIGNADNIAISESSVLTAHSTVVTRQETRVVNLSNVEEVASRIDTTPNGKKSWSENWGLLTTSESVVGSNGSQTQTTTNPDGSTMVRTAVYGRPTSEISTAYGGAIVRSVTFGYDPHRRLESQTDARNGATTYTYTALDQVETITTPVPGPGYSAQTTTYGYDAMGRKNLETLPDNSQVSTPHNARGELTGTSGSQTYTVGYTYTSQGRMKTMTTTGQAGTEVTTWEYYPTSGLLRYKIYPDNTRTEYTYTPAGRLETRKWARGVITTYGYDNAGLQASVDYSDTTPDVSTPRNRLGQIESRSDAAGFCDLTHATDGRLLSEAYTSGMFNGVTLTHGHDTLLRRNSHTSVVGSSTLVTGYEYDGASRLWKVTSGADQAIYYYVPNSSLLDHIDHRHNGSSVMTTAKVFDKLNRLESISATTASNSVVSSTAYLYDTLNRRYKATAEDGTYWDYGYNGKGEVTSGSRKWSDNTNVAGQQFGYTFDGIGNRTQTTTNGRTASYTSDALNQYTDREVPGAVDILGSTAAQTVKVSGQSVQRKGNYFSKEIAIANSTAAQYQAITVSALKQNAGPNREDVHKVEIGHYYLPKNPESFSYDLDGNLITDGRWTYTWDGENRLISVESLGVSPPASKKKLVFIYDGTSRRLNKRVYEWNSGTYILSSETRWIYNGWNVVADLDGTNSALQRYSWGIDLSGNFGGAVGAAGLVSITDGIDSYYPAYDASGNLTALAKASNQTIIGRYTVGPFGEPIQVSEESTINLFRFSTQYCDTETGLYYFGYRFYQPAIGRWLSRDPIGEAGGMNLYAMIANNPISNVDMLGLAPSANPNPGRFDLVLNTHHSSDMKSLATIKFRAPKACPCKDLRFIQIVTSFVDNGKFEPAEIDYEAGGTVGYPYYPHQTSINNYANMTDSPGWASYGGGTPLLWKKRVASQFFETCVLCLDNWEILGCVKWGHSFIHGTVRRYGRGRDLLPMAPSPDFDSLLKGYGFKFKSYP